MSTVVYTKLKELELQDKEVFEFGNWLKNFSEDISWEDEFDSEDKDDIELVSDKPTNSEGEVMEYPWSDFSYIVVPDNDTHNVEALKIATALGSYERYDIEDSDRTFYVVK